MEKENDIKEELIKQMKEDPNKLSGTNRNSAQKILDKCATRFRRMIWITILSWLLVAIYFITVAFLEDVKNHSVILREEVIFLNFLGVILRGLFVIAVIFTILLYTRWRTLTIRQIQSRLSSIEELLRKVLETK